MVGGLAGWLAVLYRVSSCRFLRFSEICPFLRRWESFGVSSYSRLLSVASAATMAPPTKEKEMDDPGGSCTRREPGSSLFPRPPSSLGVSIMGEWREGSFGVGGSSRGFDVAVVVVGRKSPRQSVGSKSPEIRLCDPRLARQQGRPSFRRHSATYAPPQRDPEPTTHPLPSRNRRSARRRV